MALEDLIQPRLTELGKIKIGKKDEQERKSTGGGSWRMPKKLDHFLVTNMHRDARGDLEVDQGLMERLKNYCKSDVVREIPILLLSDSIEDVLQARYVWYHGRTRVAACDGRVCTYYYDQGGKEIPGGQPVPCDGEHLRAAHQDGSPKFKVHAIFSCAIAVGEARIGGVYKFRTTSIISVGQIYGSLVQIKQVTAGLLTGVPLTFVVRPMLVEPKGKPTTVYVCHCELRGQDLLQVQRMAIEVGQHRAQNARLADTARREYQLLIQAPGASDEDAEEQADVNEEFHPPADLEAERQEEQQPPAGAASVKDLVAKKVVEAKPALVEEKPAPAPAPAAAAQEAPEEKETPAPAPVVESKDAPPQPAGPPAKKHGLLF